MATGASYIATLKELNRMKTMEQGVVQDNCSETKVCVSIDRLIQKYLDILDLLS